MEDWPNFFNNLNKPIRVPYENDGTLINVRGFVKPVIKELLDSALVHKPNNSDFRQFLYKLFITRGNINPNIANDLLDEEGVERMKIAFTHSSMLAEQNSEYFETIGDRTGNKCIIWYLHRRFPELQNHPQASMYMTELKKKYEKKETLGRFAKKLRFYEYIHWRELIYVAQNFKRNVIMDNSMLEDCFESFCGVLEDMIDSRIEVGAGYQIVYNIIASLLDEEKISTDINILVDPKSQIKEVMDKRKKEFGDDYKYENEKGEKGWKSKLRLFFKQDPCLRSGSSQTPLIKEFDSELNNVKEAEFDVSKQALSWFQTHCNIVFSR